MLSLVAPQKPLNQWNNKYISPGPSGPIGCPQVNSRLDQSQPFSPMRFQLPEIVTYGSNLQDGQHRSFISGGLGPETIDMTWNNPTPRKTLYGTEWTSIQLPDVSIEPELNSTFHYNYANLKANTFNSLSSGKSAGPLPNGFSLPSGQIPRGGNYPSVIAQTTAQDIFDQRQVDPQASAMSRGLGPK